tara:strand:- start:69 stop:833 length:765 start_codon:yes stop_codon:yes gene_type:complete
MCIILASINFYQLAILFEVLIMPYSKDAFLKNLQDLNKRIKTACNASDRSIQDVTLMAVTKRFSLDAAAAAVASGINVLGENRVQEGVEKIQHASFKTRWELIGHLQSNKAKLAIQYFDRIQSVDSLKLANRLNRLASETEKQMPTLLQVNAGDDSGKFGLPLEETEGVLNEILKLDFLTVEGFMTIAPLPPNLDTAKKAFVKLRELRDHLKSLTGQPLPELSMGMTFDLEAAIAAGSTCIRVGSALFGERPPL